MRSTPPNCCSPSAPWWKAAPRRVAGGRPAPAGGATAAAGPAAAAPGARTTPRRQAGTRHLELTVGPAARPGQADNLVDLFKEITDLGTIEPLDGGQSADGMRRFKVTTTSDDNDLLDLFGFHVSREQVRLAPLSRATASTPAHRAPPERRTAPADLGYGFFDDAPGAPGEPPGGPGASGVAAAAAGGGRRPGRRRPARAPGEKAAGAPSPARCACRWTRSTSSSTWWANSSSRRPCWRRTARAWTPRCTSRWPAAWPTWNATRATCRKR
jgi:two-component system chemotaxis sensor kinase CheA